MEKLILIIGGNLYDRLALIQKAKDQLEDKIGVCIQYSSIFETEAWGGKSSGSYLNQVLVFQTKLKPQQILQCILQIERECGRERIEKWGNRTMDIDILYFGDTIVNDDDLLIPHPHISDRKFVLEPMVEVMPDFIHPISGKTQIELLHACNDSSKVEIYKKSPD